MVLKYGGTKRQILTQMFLAFLLINYEIFNYVEIKIIAKNDLEMYESETCKS